MTPNTSLLYASSQIMNYEIYKQTEATLRNQIGSTTQVKYKMPFSGNIFSGIACLYELRQTG